MKKFSSNNTEAGSCDLFHSNRYGYRINLIIVTGCALFAYFLLIFTPWTALIFIVFDIGYPLYGTIKIAIALYKHQFKLACIYCSAILLTTFVSFFSDETLRFRFYIHLLMHQQQYQTELDAMPIRLRSKSWHVANRDGNESYTLVFDEAHTPVSGEANDKKEVCHSRSLLLPFPYYVIATWCP